MAKIDIIRAWKDEEYRSGLSDDQLAALPANPAGPMEIRDEDLELAGGGSTVGPGCSTASPSCSSCIRCSDTSSWSFSCQTS
jgi:mersacidin/lichenicidin family type 2 lantibiotic